MYECVFCVSLLMLYAAKGFVNRDNIAEMPSSTFFLFFHSFYNFLFHYLMFSVHHLISSFTFCHIFLFLNYILIQKAGINTITERP